MGRSLILDESSVREAASELAARDGRFAPLLSRNGPPPLWARPGGFPTLVRIVLEQQVSLDSAAAAYGKLATAVDVVSPERFLELDEAELRDVGFSRQKAGYCRGLATGLLDGTIDLEELGSLRDDEVRHRLLAIRGIGPWSADVYLMFALRRPDIWPTGDRALVVSMAETFGLDQVPMYAAADEMAARWRPWRSVAARMLWHAYLRRRGRQFD